MEKEKKDRSKIVLAIISILTLLTLIAGATFAWFTATVVGNEEASSVIVEAATLGIVYTDGNEIRLENAKPEATGSKTFTIASAEGTTLDQSYNINWNIETFNFAQKSDLVFSLSGQTDGSGTVCSNITKQTMPENTGLTEICSGTVKPDETHTYNLEVEFLETNTNQNSNQGKNFYGKIEVTAEKISAQ